MKLTKMNIKTILFLIITTTLSCNYQDKYPCNDQYSIRFIHQGDTGYLAKPFILTSLGAKKQLDKLIINNPIIDTIEIVCHCEVLNKCK